MISVLVKRFRLLMESIHNRMSRALHKEQSEELQEAVRDVVGVMTVDELRAREQGHYVIVDVKIGVNPRITVLEGHDIAKEVKSTLMRKFPYVSDVFIQLTPYEPGFAYVSGADREGEEQPTIVH